MNKNWLTGTKQILGLMIAWAGSSFFSFAQESNNFSLKKCVAYSLENHRSNTIYTNNVKFANQQFMEGLSAYLPQVNGTLTFDDNLKRQTTIIPAGIFGPDETQIQFGNQYTTNAMLQADQVIYDQSLITGLQAAKPNIEVAELKKLQNEESLVYATASYYYQALIYKEQYKLLEENERKFTEINNVQQLQYEKGVITKTDMDRVKVSLNNITSQKKVAEMNLDLAMNRLKNAMGMPLESSLEITDSIAYEEAPELPSAVSFVTDNILDYKIQTANIVLQDYDMRRKKSLFVPTLSFYARYGAQSFGNDFAQSFKNWFDYSSIGLRMNIPIFDGLKKLSLVNQSRLNLLNAKENLELSEDNIKLQYQNSTLQLLSSYNNLMADTENLELAREVFENTGLQYEKGVASLTDVLNADYAYKESQSNYINSLLKYMISKIDLEKSKGTLKQYIEQL